MTHSVSSHKDHMMPTQRLLPTPEQTVLCSSFGLSDATQIYITPALSLALTLFLFYVKHPAGDHLNCQIENA